MSLTQSVVRLAEEQASAHRAKKIKVIRLQIGVLSHVEPEAMQFCFDVVAQGTLADGATLEIERIEGAAWCPRCEKTVAIEQRFDACPTCGEYGLRVTDGDQMQLKDMEIEVE